jgi:transposase-like protein
MEWIVSCPHRLHRLADSATSLLLVSCTDRYSGQGCTATFLLRFLHLTPAQRQTLLAWQRATTISAGRARRARMILLVAKGMPITDIADTVGISRRFVYKWVQRFREQGMEGLADKPRPGYHRVPRPAAVADSPRLSA